MKKKIQVASAVALALSSVSFAQQAVQWKVSGGGNGHWYQLLPNQQTTFWQTVARATAEGGYLVSITGAAENAFVRHISPGRLLHFGAFQDSSASGWFEPSGGWSWVSGEPWSWTGWCTGQPDNSPWGGFSGQELARFSSPESGCWDDAHSAQQIATWAIGDTMIEWSADCNGDGIVDYGQCRDGSLPDYNGNNIPDCCESGTPCVVGNYPVQWRVAEGGNGHWYQLTSTPLPWAQAQQLSQARGGHLVTVTSAAERDLTWSVVGVSPQAFWIGGYQPLGSCEPGCGWRWVTDEPFAYTNWCSECPNNNTVNGNEDAIHDGFGLYWNDVTSNAALPFMIEWSADCNNDGIVDKGQILQGHLPDINDNGIPDSCEQPTCRNADLLADRNINGADLGILLSQWGPNTQYTISDINSDGVVDGSDLGLLLSFWGPCPY